MRHRRLGPCTIALALILWGAGAARGAEPTPAVIAKGEQVYGAKKCGMCHSINGKGGKSGGDLTTVGATREADWLKRFTKDPRSVDPKAKMPAFKGTEEELDAVVAYLTSLK